ncbi:hypothetical protein C9I57_01640 [Trinickia symbiotica]|uniref:Glycine-rich domain-containing protein-like n=1 Tax=Trinickia symbiotica TaxID=863227 RepID=A0A2T3Y246_9BURK|nr:hypothetical protein C9I57_01640 [Trinickia symbiotica]
MKSKLLHKHRGAVTEHDIARAEAGYRQFLKIIAKYPDAPVVPSEAVDEFWHMHILDTQRYGADCERIFGYMVHHDPYIGIDGPQDEARLADAARSSHALFMREFGTAAEAPAYCIRSAEGATAAYCIRAEENGASAAYCIRQTVDAASAAYCIKQAADMSSAAYCIKQTADASSAGYCIKQTADMSSAAYCIKQMADMSAAAYCIKQTTDMSSAAYCIRQAVGPSPAAYCIRSGRPAPTAAAYCIRA